jgi:cation diffusion facilitator CzcD-associated flavoprotein CzcO
LRCHKGLSQQHLETCDTDDIPGWYGLAAAKAYIELHPDESVVVLEAGSSIGGVWSHERLYPGLKSNNMLGTYEYSDYPMDTATFGVKPGEHIPGTVLHKYLTSFAKEFDVYPRTRLNTRVDSAEENVQR